MQSLTGPEQINKPLSGDMTTLQCSTVQAALVAAIMLFASLSGCSLLDTKSDAGGGQLNDRASAAGVHPVDDRPETATEQQGLEAVVAQLADDQKQYEARLLALEAIVLRDYPLAQAAGYHATRTSVATMAAAEQLPSEPIEPDVILHPETEPAVGPAAVPLKQASTGVGGMAPPAQDKKSPVSTPVETSPPPVARSGNWVINLGSYSNKHIAKRMLTGFRQQDIDAEQVSVVLNNRTLYRVRITGFDTRQEAIRHARSLQGILDIEDVWIMRN